MIEMGEIRITRVIKELMSLLQKMDRGISESEEEYEMLERYALEVDLDELKEELGSWYIADCKLYVGA
jgi:hypothetical protein